MRIIDATGQHADCVGCNRPGDRRYFEIVSALVGRRPTSATFCEDCLYELGSEIAKLLRHKQDTWRAFCPYCGKFPREARMPVTGEWVRCEPTPRKDLGPGPFRCFDGHEFNGERAVGRELAAKLRES